MINKFSVRKLSLSLGLVLSVLAGSASAEKPVGTEICEMDGGYVVYYYKQDHAGNFYRTWRCEGAAGG